MKIMNFSILTILLITFSINHDYVNCVNEANWFSKSLDYYELKNCSFFIRSAIIGDFQSCLNKPTPKNETSSDADADGPDNDLTTTDGNSTLVSTTPSAAEDEEIQVTDADWPLSLCSATQKVIDCFPTILDRDCLVDNERQFFETTKNIFQAQHEYSCENGEKVARAVKNDTMCSMKTEQNQETRCYSLTTNKYRWMGWRLSYQDGQMCKYLLDIKLCELKGYDACPDLVLEFLTAFWDAGLSVPRCPTEKAPKGTTLNPWDKFIDNDYNWNADGMQDSYWNPWKGKIGKRSVDAGDDGGHDKDGKDGKDKKKEEPASDKWTKMGSNFDYKQFMGGNKENSFGSGSDSSKRRRVRFKFHGRQL